MNVIAFLALSKHLRPNTKAVIKVYLGERDQGAVSRPAARGVRVNIRASPNCHTMRSTIHRTPFCPVPHPNNTQYKRKIEKQIPANASYKDNRFAKHGKFARRYSSNRHSVPKCLPRAGINSRCRSSSAVACKCGESLLCSPLCVLQISMKWYVMGVVGIWDTCQVWKKSR